MAALKGKRSRKKSQRQLTYFREVKGKIVEKVEIDPDLNAIIILFQDKTALSFDLEPRLTVFPELSDWARLETGVELKDGEQCTAKCQGCHGHNSPKPNRTD